MVRPSLLVSRAGETPLFGFLTLWHHFEPLIQSEGFQASGSFAFRSHTDFANFRSSSAAPFPGLFHPGSTYGLFSTGVSPPTTVHVLSHALSPHVVAGRWPPYLLPRGLGSNAIRSPLNFRVLSVVRVRSLGLRCLAVGPVVPLLRFSFLGFCPQRSIGNPFRPPPLVPFRKRTPRRVFVVCRLQSLFATP